MSVAFSTPIDKIVPDFVDCPDIDRPPVSVLWLLFTIKRHIRLVKEYLRTTTTYIVPI